MPTGALGASGVTLVPGADGPGSAGVEDAFGVEGVELDGGCSDVSEALGSPEPSVGEGAPLSLGDWLGVLGVVESLGSGVSDGVEGLDDPEGLDELDPDGALDPGVLALGEDDVGACCDGLGPVGALDDGAEAPGVGTRVGPSTL